MSDNVQKVAVLGSSTMSNDDFCDDGRALGASLAHGGYTVILPGDLDSIKGDVMIGALNESGNVVNVYTDPGASPFAVHPPNLNDDLLKEKTMVEGRSGLKKSLDTRADMAVLLPGGLEELDQAMHLARRGTPLIIVSTAGFYAGLAEQIETIKESRLNHQFPGGTLDHVHVVADVEEVSPIVEKYNGAGTPEYDYAQLWSRGKAEDRAVRGEREGHAPGFTYRDKKFTLSTEAGIMALEQTARGLLDDSNVPMEIDNSTGYYDGLVAQFQNYLDEGAENNNVLSNVTVLGDTSEYPDIQGEPEIATEHGL